MYTNEKNVSWYEMFQENTYLWYTSIKEQPDIFKDIAIAPLIDSEWSRCMLHYWPHSMIPK